MIEQEIVVDGVKIRYVKNIEKARKPVFVFLHGWGAQYTYFRPMYESGLVDNMLAFDFPGFGGSDILKEAWNVERYADVTRVFLDKVLDGKKIIFVAHSFGGRVLVKLLAKKEYAHIKKLILIGVPFVRHLSGMQKLFMRAAKACKPLVAHPLLKKMKLRVTQLIGATDYAALGDDEIMKETFNQVIAEDMLSYISVLKSYQTECIWGSEDMLVPLADAEEVSKQVGAILHVVPEAGHVPFIEKKDAFLEAFKKALAT